MSCKFLIVTLPKTEGTEVTATINPLRVESIWPCKKLQVPDIKSVVHLVSGRDVFATETYDTLVEGWALALESMKDKI